MSFQIPGGDSWSKLNQVKASQQTNTNGGGGSSPSYFVLDEEPDQKFDEIELSSQNPKDEFEIVVDCTILDIIKNFIYTIITKVKNIFIS